MLGKLFSKMTRHSTPLQLNNSMELLIVTIIKFALKNFSRSTKSVYKKDMWQHMKQLFSLWIETFAKWNKKLVKCWFVKLDFRIKFQGSENAAMLKEFNGCKRICELSLWSLRNNKKKNQIEEEKLSKRIFYDNFRSVL